MVDHRNDPELSPDGRMRRRIAAALAAGAGAVGLGLHRAHGDDVNVNAPAQYPQTLYPQVLECVVDGTKDMGPVNAGVFGTNLEWFNRGDGLIDKDLRLRPRLIELAREQGITVFRFPGGILADYYNWVDGTGPRRSRPRVPHLSDPGASHTYFGSPEFFDLLHATGAQGLITVNAGTGTAREAAAWVDYANSPRNARRQADGFPHPIGIRWWEVGNELYLPGNPGQVSIGVTPEVYAQRFVEYSRAMRAVDPSIRLLAIGVAKSHGGPDTHYPDWSEVLLRKAAGDIDLIAVHNAYFPMLYRVGIPPVAKVYRSLWAAPEAVDRSLTELEQLIARYETRRKIGIAITEWGALYSLPRYDPYWFDHVKTLGSGVYVARLLQVFLSHPRVELTNYFKLVDSSFMGWISYEGVPKVPYWVFKLFAQNTGSRRIASELASPTYDTPAFGIMFPERNVPEVTVLATRSPGDGRVFVNFVNRSLTTRYRVRLRHPGMAPRQAEILAVTGQEPTAHNGPDIPPGLGFEPAYDPYTTAAPGSIRIERRALTSDIVELPAFSVVTVVASTR
ncbi:MAG: hypothetical protein M0T84_04955 [Betaproteobacteria bacterium]|nr:hypothetical protein [Betaproteobacteria bacterium]